MKTKKVIGLNFENFDEVVSFIKKQQVNEFTCYGKLFTFIKDNVKYDYLLHKNADRTISVVKIKMEVIK